MLKKKTQIIYKNYIVLYTEFYLRIYICM